jgi:acyl-CoA synthetase (NDP forming)
MSGPQDARGPQAVARFLRPRSVAIVGISARAGSAGQVILQCAQGQQLSGRHPSGRPQQRADRRPPVLKSPDELPEGVDLAVFTLPAASVRESIEACARRKVGSAMMFAAGFAESAISDPGRRHRHRAGGRPRRRRAQLPRRHQQRRRHVLHMLYAREALRGVTGGVAFVGQSGGLLGHFQRAADGRGLRSLRDLDRQRGRARRHRFLEFLADDPATRVIALYCEQIRRPAEFLAACRRARAAWQTDRADAGGPRRKGAQGRRCRTPAR